MEGGKNRRKEQDNERQAMFFRFECKRLNADGGGCLTHLCRDLTLKEAAINQIKSCNLFVGVKSCQRV